MSGWNLKVSRENVVESGSFFDAVAVGACGIRKKVAPSPGEVQLSGPGDFVFSVL